MNGRGARYDRDYGWPEVERDLSNGCHPEIVAARIGEPVAFVIETADRQGWPITWNGDRPTASIPGFDA